MAIYRANDDHHLASIDIWRRLRSPQYTCWPVITEVVYLLKDSPAAVRSVLTKIADGHLVVLPLAAADAQAISNVFATFDDQDTDLADACLVHLAERESIPTVFTFDRRHFSVYRTASGKALSILSH